MSSPDETTDVPVEKRKQLSMSDTKKNNKKEKNKIKSREMTREIEKKNLSKYMYHQGTFPLIHSNHLGKIKAAPIFCFIFCFLVNKQLGKRNLQLQKETRGK